MTHLGVSLPSHLVRTIKKQYRIVFWRSILVNDRIIHTKCRLLWMDYSLYDTQKGVPITLSLGETMCLPTRDELKHEINLFSDQELAFNRSFKLFWMEWDRRNKEKLPLLLLEWDQTANCTWTFLKIVTLLVMSQIISENDYTFHSFSSRKGWTKIMSKIKFSSCDQPSKGSVRVYFWY